MDEKNLKDMAEQIVKDVNFEELFENEDSEEDQINFWVPKQYKMRFRSLNKESKYKLGKLVKKLIMTCIDQADQSKRAG